jgi:hypothetical protein
MAKKHMKKMLSIPDQKGNTNQTTLRFYLTPVRMAILKNLTTSKSWQGCRGKGTLIHCWWECKLVKPFGKQYGGSFKN